MARHAFGFWAFGSTCLQLAAFVTPALASPSVEEAQAYAVLAPSLVVGILLAGCVIFAGLVFTDEGSQRSSGAGSGVWRDVQRAPCTTPSPSTGGDVANFSGTWVLSAIDGDVDGFMQDMGESPAFRRAARAAKYAVGEQVHEIQQAGDAFSCRCDFTGHVTKYIVGGGEQAAAELSQGKPISVLPSWGHSGMALVCAGWYEECGRAIPRSKRFMHGGQMVMTLVSPQGTWIQRVYTRRSAGPGLPAGERPNFSGYWLQTGFGGDPAAFLQEQGIGIMMRKAAAASGYGTGSFTVLATHKDGQFDYRIPGGPGYSVSSLKPGEVITTTVPRNTMDATGPCDWQPDGSLRWEAVNEEKNIRRTFFFRLNSPEEFQITVVSAKGVEFHCYFKMIQPLLHRDERVTVKADFSGLWRLVEMRNKARYDEALAWHGVGWPLRAAAKKKDYLIGKFPLACYQDGDVLSFCFGKKGLLMYARADGRRQAGWDIMSTTSGVDVSFQFDPTGFRLLHRVFRKDGESVEITMEIIDEKLVLTRPFPDGAFVQRVYARRVPEDDLDPAKNF